MKSKKLLLPTIILIVAIFVIAVYSVISCIETKPTITEAEFPFSITYELDGETVTIEDVYKVRYLENSEYGDGIYAGEIGNRGENNSDYILKEDADGGTIELQTRFYTEFMMGDSEYDYFDEGDFAPVISYYDAEGYEYMDEETLSAHGVKLIDYEYPSPIENSFAFSQITYLRSEVVFPTVLISALAMLAIIIFVKKEKELQYKAVDKVSIVFNFVIGCALTPYVSLAAALVDINGGGDDIYRKIMYYMPSLLILCIAGSIALRRKGYGAKALITELVGPAAFAVFMIVCGFCGLL